MKVLVNKNGYGVLGCLLFLPVLLFAFAGFGYMANANRSVSLQAKERAIGEGFSIELLEFFRSMPASETLSRLKTFPYPPCAHVNLHSQGATGGSILNPDSIADLSSAWTNGPTTLLDVNRFYQVRVMNVSTREERTDICDLSDWSSVALAPQEKLLVTVGVSWSKKVGDGRRDRVAYSTLLP